MDFTSKIKSVILFNFLEYYITIMHLILHIIELDLNSIKFSLYNHFGKKSHLNIIPKEFGATHPLDLWDLLKSRNQGNKARKKVKKI